MNDLALSVFIMLQTFHTKGTSVEKGDQYISQYNNRNYGGGVEIDRWSGDYAIGANAGAYKNSYNDLTIMAGGHAKYKVGPVILSAALSFATGYEKYGQAALTPLPTVGIQLGPIRIVTTAPFTEAIGWATVTNVQATLGF